MSISEYTVGNVKEIRGHDGQGFSCNLLRNKKKVAEIFDDGWGGGLQYLWLDNSQKSVVQTRGVDDEPRSFNGTVEESNFYAEVMKLPKLPASDGLPEMFTNPDIVVEDMVNDILMEKDIKKEFKKHLNIQCSNGEIRTWKVSPKFNIEMLKAHALKTHPDCVVLNELPVKKVIEIYKKANLM